MANDARTRRLYLLLLAVQTIGTVIIYWNGIPHYRGVAANPGGHVPRLETLEWSLPSIVVMQIAYWIRHPVVPALPRFISNAPCGHAVLFVAHLVFDVAVVFFTFVFITRPTEFQMPALRYVITIAGLFCLFCYSLELERLGKSLLDSKQKLEAPVR